MSDQITTAFVQQYTSNVQLLQQQMMSNLRGAVDVETGVKGEFTYFEQVAATAMTEIGNRHGDTTYTDTIHRRRRVALRDYDVADLIDNPDKVRTLIDPTNSYVRQFAAAANRQTDDTIISAFDAAVSTGKTGSGTDSFDSTNYEIAVNFEGGGSDTNLTTAKLREARRILEAAENPEDDGDNQWYLVCSAAQRQGLLGDTEFQNSDYNSVKALVDGSVDTWLGFKFIKSERLPSAAGNVTSVFAWRKASMKLAIGSESRGYVDVLPGKRHSTQVRYTTCIGAVRMDQVGVVRILADDDE
jgi:hypothetical protein